MQVSVSEAHIRAWKHRAEQQAKHDARAAQQARDALPHLIELLQSTYHTKHIILFGSLAHGCFHTQSDIDLAVEGIEPAQFFYALADLNALAPSRVDLKPLESLEVHFKQRVLSTGEVLV